MFHGTTHLTLPRIVRGGLPKGLRVTADIVRAHAQARRAASQQHGDPIVVEVDVATTPANGEGFAITKGTGKVHRMWRSNA